MADNILNILISANADGVKKGADEAKDHLDSAAASVGILGDLVGVSVPEALQKALVGVEGLGTALNAAFVPLQVISFLEQIEELRNKVSEAAHGLSQSWIEVSDTFDRFHQNSEIALLQLAQRLDALSGNHLAQLKDKLREIDAQSMRSLGAQFDEIAKKADSFFASMEVGWFKSLFVGKRVQDGIKNIHQEFDLLMGRIQSMEKAGNFKGIASDLDQLIKKTKDWNDADDRTWSVITAEGKEIHAVRLRELEILQSLKAAYEDIAKLNQGQREEAQRGFAQLTTANRQVVDLTSNVHRASTILQQLDRQSKAQSSAEMEAQAALANLNNIFAQQAKKNLAEQYQEAASYYQGLIEMARGQAQVTEANAARDLAQGKITKQQEIQIVADAKIKELALEIDYYRTLQNFSATSAKERAQLENKITRDLQQQLVIRARSEAESAKATDQSYKQLWSSIGGTFKSTVDGLIQGNETIQQAFQKLYAGLLQDLINYEAQQMEKKLAAWIQDHIFQKTKAASEIHTASAVGAGWAYADMASTGPAGLAAAPAVAAATQGAIESFNAEAMAAAGGQWEVPGLQLTMLHPREMVLPAGLASRMRDVVEGRGGGAGGVTVVVNHSVNAVDAQSFQGLIRRNGNVIGNEVARVLKRKGFAPAS